MKLLTTFKSILSGRETKREKKLEKYFFWFLVIFSSVLYAFMSFRKLQLFESYGWDLSIFDQGIWQWSKFQFPFSSFHNLPWLADHFHPILLTLAPLYWFVPGAGTLVIIQAILVCLGAVPLYLLSLKVTKHRLFSIAVAVGYLFFFSIQWHVFSEFHELTFLPITFGSALYFWQVKKKNLYWFFFILALLVKEEIGLLFAAFGLWAFITNKDRKKEAILTIVLGVLYTSFVVGYLMPVMAGGVYRHSGFGPLGETPFQVVVNLVKNPILIVKVFIDSNVKLNTMFTAFWPWGFLPLLSPATLLLPLQQFAVRFVDYEKTIRWTPYFAYSLPIAVVTAWGSIYGFRNLLSVTKKKFGKKNYLFGSFVSVFLLVLIGFQQVILHAPINSIFKPSFYRTEQWMEDNKSVLRCIPKDASLSAQNNLAPWVSERDKIKVFPEGLNEGYQYLAIDLHKGQSENSFFFLGSKNTEFLVSDLISRNLYKVVCKQGDAMVLKKIGDTTGKLNYPFPIEIYEK